MISTGLRKTKTVYNCCFVQCVVILTKMVMKLHAMGPLTLVKMAANHAVASILMRSSVKMKTSHTVCYFKTFVFLNKS